MRIVLLAVLISATLDTAAAQTGPVPVTAGRPGLPDRCAAAGAEYDKVLKRLAQSTAEGAFPGGKSLKLRMTEEQLLVSLAEGSGSGCARAFPLSPEPYLLAAMKCERAKRAAKAPVEPAACDMTRWKPFAE